MSDLTCARRGFLVSVGNGDRKGRSVLDGSVDERVDECDSQPHSPLPADVIRNELERILKSATFRSARGQRGFLRYAVEEVIAGRGHLLKEYVIGMEAFGRGESFDPRLDPIVRTQARKLRAKLAAYYETEGSTDPVRIEFRKGCYAPSFQMTDTQSRGVAGVPVIATAPAEPRYSANPLVPVAPPARHWRIAVISIAVLTLASAGSIAFYLRQSSGRERVLAADASVAVMPFVNVSDNREDEFLSDGITDDLIDSLGQMPGLHVVARTSAFRFKGKARDVRDVGQKLKVRTVLEGSVRKSGNRLRVTVQLNNAADGYHLWSGSYDREANDAGAIHWEISQEVANVLGVRLARGEEQDLRKAFPKLASPNPGAYQNYLKGLYFWNKLTAEGLKAAIQYFEQAIVEDPSFARAYTALADCYVMAPQVAATPQLEIIPKIEAAASKALELDSTLGEAHIDLAICAEYDFDWETAEREFKKGLELSPENAVGHLWYAKYLAVMGRKPEVLVQRKIAAELDPASPYAVQSVAGYLSVMGRYDEAIEQFRGALTMEPNFGLTHQGLGVAYLLKGSSAEGIGELQVACKLMDGPRRRALLGWAYGITGKTVEARRILNDFLQEARRKPFPALAIAEVYIGLGDKDHAFEWLERAADQRDLNMDLQWDSFYESLRSDPRYSLLLRRLKLG
jgi:TolB-like protein/Tfp pilus assembly protein PilF